MLASTACCATCCATKCAFNTLDCITKRSNILTRIVYILIFLFVTTACWMWYAWGAEWYADQFPSSVLHVNCQADVCFGVMSVYRITMILTMFYTLHAIFAAACGQSKMNSGWGWGLKLLLLAGGIVSTFWIPNEVFLVWAWIAIVGSAVFLLLQMVLLVDFAHTFAENLLEKYHDNPDDSGPTFALWSIFTTLVSIAVAFTITEYIMFSSESGCGNNAILVSVNVVLILIGAGLAIHPRVQEANPNSGFLQAATVAAYTAYLVWSAFMSLPNHECNSLHIAKQSFSAVTGAVIVFVSVCYSAFRASNSILIRVTSRASSEETLPIINDDEATRGGPTPKPFNYVFFHTCFALASCYVAMLITRWDLVSDNESDTDYVIDKSLTSMWVKMATSWVCHLLYLWSLVGPILLPDREWYS